MNNIIKKEQRGKYLFIILPDGTEYKMSKRYKTKKRQENEIKERIKEFLVFEEVNNDIQVQKIKTKKRHTEIPFRLSNKTIVYVPEYECYYNYKWLDSVGGIENMLEKIKQYKIIKYGTEK